MTEPSIQTYAPAESPPLGVDALIAVIAGVLGIIVTMMYPVGLCKLAIQLYGDFTDDLITAWYAASLAPKAFVAGEVVPIFLAAIAASCVALALGTIAIFTRGRHKYSFEVRIRTRNSKGVTQYTGEVEGVPEEFLTNNYLVIHKGLVKVVAIILTVLGILGLIYFGAKVVDSSAELAFYAAFVAVTAAGGALGALAIIEKPHARIFEEREGALLGDEQILERLQDRLNDLYIKNFRRWLVLGLLVSLVGALLATFLLARVTELSLPYAVFETPEGETGTLRLLTVSNGYWHGFNCKEELVAIPIDEATRVQIFSESNLRVICPE